MGVSGASVQNETGWSGDRIRRPRPANSWAGAGARGRGGTAGPEETPSCASWASPGSSPFSPGCFVYLVKAGNVERMEELFFFLSFFFSFLILNVHMNSSFLGCKCPQRTRKLRGGKTKSPERDTNKATLVRVPSAVNSFPFLVPVLRPGEPPSPTCCGCRGTPAHPGLGAAESSGPGPGAGEGRRAAAPAGSLRAPWEPAFRERGLGFPRPGPAAAGEARPGRCRRVTPAPGVANRKRKSRGTGVFSLIRFTL